MLTPELQTKVIEWRAKANDGTITLPEMKEAIIALRSGRKNAAEAATASKSRAKKPAKDVGSMLNELEGL